MRRTHIRKRLSSLRLTDERSDYVRGMSRTVVLVALYCFEMLCYAPLRTLITNELQRHGVISLSVYNGNRVHVNRRLLSAFGSHATRVTRIDCEYDAPRAANNQNTHTKTPPKHDTRTRST